MEVMVDHEPARHIDREQVLADHDRAGEVALISASRASRSTSIGTKWLSRRCGRRPARDLADLGSACDRRRRSRGLGRSACRAARASPGGKNHSWTRRSTPAAQRTRLSQTVVSPENATRQPAVSNRKPNAGATGRWSTATALIAFYIPDRAPPRTRPLELQRCGRRPAFPGDPGSRSRCQSAMVASAKAFVPAGPKIRCGQSLGPKRRSSTCGQPVPKRDAHPPPVLQLVACVGARSYGGRWPAARRRGRFSSYAGAVRSTPPAVLQSYIAGLRPTTSIGSPPPWPTISPSSRRSGPWPSRSSWRSSRRSTRAFRTGVTNTTRPRCAPTAAGGYAGARAAPQRNPGPAGLRGGGGDRQERRHPRARLLLSDRCSSRRDRRTRCRAGRRGASSNRSVALPPAL